MPATPHMAQPNIYNVFLQIENRTLPVRQSSELVEFAQSDLFFQMAAMKNSRS